MRWLSKRIGKRHDDVMKAMKSQKVKGEGLEQRKSL